MKFDLLTGVQEIRLAILRFADTAAIFILPPKASHNDH